MKQNRLPETAEGKPCLKGPSISTGGFFGANALYTLVLSPILPATRRKLWSPHQESPPPSGFPASASPTPRPLFHGELVFFCGSAYLFHMPSTFQFCVPTTSTTVPHADEWLHEIKYDGYRLRLERDGMRVRLITRGGYDWTKRFPWIVEAALKKRPRRLPPRGR
jgi:ATP dependent DNA ligase domain